MRFFPAPAGNGKLHYRSQFYRTRFVMSSEVAMPTRNFMQRLETSRCTIHGTAPESLDFARDDGVIPPSHLEALAQI
jgi:hypothetical protein